MNWEKIFSLSSLGTMAAGMLWLFNNMAWASDITAIEVRLIKQDIRELRREAKLHTEDEATLGYLQREIEELIDELCNIKPDDRECA